MTPNEVAAFAAKVNNDRQFAGKRVYIKRHPYPEAEHFVYLYNNGNWGNRAMNDFPA